MAENLSYDELELLYMARKGDSLNDWHREHFDDADITYAKFLQEGYLRQATIEELISASYKVVDLKKIASENSIKITGMKKALAITTLISQLPRNKLVEVLRGCKRFSVLTEKGAITLKEHKERKEALEKELYNSFVESISSRKFFSLPDDNRPLTGQYVTSRDKVKDLFENSCNDLSLDNKNRDKMAAIICACSIRGYSIYETARLFAEACDNIPELKFPKDIYKYTDDKEGSGNYDPSFLYVHTCIFRTNGKFSLIYARKNENIIGVEITATFDQHGCKKCQKMHGKRFTPDKAPKLPFHWGCRCCYDYILFDEKL